ncbi:MAG: hypothetical protein NC485_10915 [Ruminococcus flavefaciens]|nr:hypothetical protein [Ruminococcus flavefaciens]MCM1062523.1 hypothetical protein [Eubacterium sp.]
MGMKDTVTKEYMQNTEVFADTFNFLIYGGEQIIRPENLHELDMSEIVLPYGDDNKSEPVQKFPDVLKMATAMADENAAYLILGIEKQRIFIMQCRLETVYTIYFSTPSMFLMLVNRIKIPII